MPTLQVLAMRYGYDDLSLAFPDVDIPVVTGVQRQGDVLVLPSQPPSCLPGFGRRQGLRAGVVVVGSESSGHTHTLYGDGTVRRLADPTSPAALPRPDATVAWLRVPAGGEAFLMHSDEHCALGIGPGTYQLRRQLEYRDPDQQTSAYWKFVRD